MRSDELYKFSDGTLTRLRTSLDDITKNIQMEYLPQRRWSSLEKKRAHIMIKAIDKQLKERRMMMSFEKVVKAVNDTKRPTMHLIIWSYKMVRYRYTFLRSSQNRRDLPRDILLVSVEVHRDIPLVSVEFHRYDIKKSKSENKGRVPTEMELVLEQSQQGTSYKVSVCVKGLEIRRKS
ncbi:hypothetical protein Tco_1554982 [Tanacetum coccineum]